MVQNTETIPQGKNKSPKVCLVLPAAYGRVWPQSYLLLKPVFTVSFADPLPPLSPTRSTFSFLREEKTLCKYVYYEDRLIQRVLTDVGFATALLVIKEANYLPLLQHPCCWLPPLRYPPWRLWNARRVWTEGDGFVESIHTFTVSSSLSAKLLRI